MGMNLAEARYSPLSPAIIPNPIQLAFRDNFAGAYAAIEAGAECTAY